MKVLSILSWNLKKKAHQDQLPILPATEPKWASSTLKDSTKFSSFNAEQNAQKILTIKDLLKFSKFWVPQMWILIWKDSWLLSTWNRPKYKSMSSTYRYSITTFWKDKNQPLTTKDLAKFSWQLPTWVALEDQSWLSIDLPI